jgi:hypothetical protein
MEMNTLDELEAIRARHEAAKQALDDDRYYSSPNGYPPPSFSHDSGKRAHADRATLLRLLDAARAEVDRLEDALDEIAAHYNGGITGPGRLQADSMRDIARAALKGT